MILRRFRNGSRLLLAAMVALAPARAQEEAAAGTAADSAADTAANGELAPPPQPVDPLAMKPFDFDIEVRTIKELEKQVSAQEFARTLRVRGGVFPPRLPAELVQTKIAERITYLVQQAYPDSEYDKIERDAEKEYAMYPVNSKVAIGARQRGRKAVVEGTLMNIHPERIQVGTVWIAKPDIDEEFLPHLYRGEHEKAVQRYIANHKQRFDSRKADFRARKQKEITGRAWRFYGYMRIGGKPTPAIDVFNEKYRKHTAAVEAKIRRGIQTEVYGAQGWIYNAEIRKWVHKEPEVIADAATDGAAAAGDASALDAVRNMLDKIGDAVGGEEDGDLWETGDDKPEKKPEKKPKPDDPGDQEPGGADRVRKAVMPVESDLFDE